MLGLEWQAISLSAVPFVDVPKVYMLPVAFDNISGLADVANLIGERPQETLTLPPAKAAGFSVHRGVLPVGSLTGPPQAFREAVGHTSSAPTACSITVDPYSLPERPCDP